MGCERGCVPLFVSKGACVMDKFGRRWMSPVLPSYTDQNAKAMSDTALSLTEFFNQIVGVWDYYEEVTDNFGNVTVAHGAPFTPSVVLITERVSTAGIYLGGHAIVGVPDDEVKIYFMDQNGSNRSNRPVKFHMLCLP